MASTLDRLTYAARQTARVAWYAGHYAAGRRLLKPMPKPDFPDRATPSRAELTADMRAAVRARMAGHRGRPVSRAARAGTGARRIPAPQPALFPRPAAGRCAAPRRARRRAAARHPGRRPARLLPAELPLPERRLAVGPFRRDLRHAGRGAVHRRRRRHAPPRAEADRRVDGRPQPARTPRPRRRLRHRPPARLPARRLARHEAHRHRSQRALSRRSAPPDRPHGAGEADRRRRRGAAVRRREPRSRRLLVPAARAAEGDSRAGPGRDGARAEARRPGRDRRFAAEGRSPDGTVCSTSSRTISTSRTTRTT